MVQRVSLANIALGEEDLQKLYMWVDEIPLSRPKRNIARDFADAVLVAEVVAHFFPHLVELHNYSAANSMQQKTYNWNTMQQKVFRKLGFMLLGDDVSKIAKASAGAIEKLLFHLQFRLAAYKQKASLRRPADGAAFASDGRSVAGTPGTAPSAVGGGNGSMGGLADGMAGVSLAPQMLTATPSAAHGHGAMSRKARVDTKQDRDLALLAEKEARIMQLEETVELLEIKNKKLEQMLTNKDARIAQLTSELYEKDSA